MLRLPQRPFCTSSWWGVNSQVGECLVGLRGVERLTRNPEKLANADGVSCAACRAPRKSFLFFFFKCLRLCGTMCFLQVEPGVYPPAPCCQALSSILLSVPLAMGSSPFAECKQTCKVLEGHLRVKEVF